MYYSPGFIGLGANDSMCQNIEAENDKLAIVEIGNIFPRNLFCNSRKVNVTILQNILVNDLFSL